MATGTVGNSIQVIDKANGFDFSLDIQNNNYQSGTDILLQYQNLTMTMKTPVLIYQYSKMLHN